MQVKQNKPNKVCCIVLYLDDMGEIISNNTFTDLLEKNDIRRNNDLYVERIGKITHIHGNNLCSVEFLEYTRNNDQQFKIFIHYCPISQNCSEESGNVIKYNVGDYVRIRFTDIDYRKFLIDREPNTTINDVALDVITHSIDNAYVAGKHSLKVPPISEGWFSQGAKYSFADGKLDLASKDIAFKEVLNYITQLCDYIISLNNNITSPSGACTIANIKDIENIKTNFQIALNKLL